MEMYKEMYGKIFNCITDVIILLQKVQLECEEMYSNKSSDGIVIFCNNEKED